MLFVVMSDCATFESHTLEQFDFELEWSAPSLKEKAAFEKSYTA